MLHASSHKGATWLTHTYKPKILQTLNYLAIMAGNSFFFITFNTAIPFTSYVVRRPVCKKHTMSKHSHQENVNDYLLCNSQVSFLISHKHLNAPTRKSSLNSSCSQLHYHMNLTEKTGDVIHCNLISPQTHFLSPDTTITRI